MVTRFSAGNRRNLIIFSYPRGTPSYHGGFPVILTDVSTLEQLVAGEWFEIRERLHRPEQLFDYLYLEDGHEADPAARTAALDELARLLDESIEGGVFEVRRRVINLVFSQLAEAEFSSEVFTQLGALAGQLTGLVLVDACQRALLAQDMPFLQETDDETETETDAEDGAQRDVNQIIADVKEIIQADPNAKMNAAIKNILLQLQKYREETATYRKLKEQANSYRLEMYSRTFAATFNQIFESIRKNYAMFLEEQEETRRRAEPSVVQNLDTRAWTRSLQSHIETLSRARATLLFAMREHTGVREPIVRLSRRREELVAAVHAEERSAAEIAGSEAAVHRLSRIMARDIAARLRRWRSQITSS